MPRLFFNRIVQTWPKSGRKIAHLFRVSSLVLAFRAFADVTPIPATNKLLMMHRIYYLPFSIGFQQGSNLDEIIPVIAKTGVVPTPLEFSQLGKIWASTREEWFKSSLILNTPLKLNESNRISAHLASHRTWLNRRPFDSLSVAEQVQIRKLLDGKPNSAKRTFTQIRFLKSFLDAHDENRNVFFVVGASWCQSSRTYRALLESYLKKFPLADLTIHSLVIEDPQNQIFESPLLSTLFPNTALYSHNTIPRFLFLENNADQPVLYEEGDAVSALLDRYFAKYRGFLDSSVPFLTPSKRELTGGWQYK